MADLNHFSVIQARFLFLPCGLLGKTSTRTRPQPGGKATEPSTREASSCSWSFLYSFDWVVSLCWWAASSSLLYGLLLSIRLSRFSFSLHFPSFSISAPLLLRKPPTSSPPQASAPAHWLLRWHRCLPLCISHLPAAVPGQASYVARAAVQRAGPVPWLGCAPPGTVEPVLGSS